MAHNLMTLSNGNRAYVGRQSAWHTLGTVTGAYQTWADLCEHGLNYPVEKQQLKDSAGNDIPAWGTFRTDTTPHTFLGTVGERYTVVHHSRGFEMVDALVQSISGAHYETAGALGNGERVWGLAALNMSLSVGDDKSENYLLFNTAYDGTGSHDYGLTSVRVVCANTLNRALRGKNSSLFRIRHTRNANARLDDAHRALTTIQAEVQTLEEQLNMLAGRKMTREAMSDIFDRLFPKKEDKETGRSESSTRRDNVLRDILASYEYCDADAFPEQRGTAYNLLNAITEYTDHTRSTRNGNRAESAVFGSGEALKNEAFDIILETAAGLPVVERRQIFVPSVAPISTPVSPVTTQGSLLDLILKTNDDDRSTQNNEPCDQPL